MISFREYLQAIDEQNTVGVHNDGPGSGFGGGGGMAFVPSHFTNSEDGINNKIDQTKLASLDGLIRKSVDNLDLNKGETPLVTRKSRIMHMAMEENPIRIHLADGTRLFFTRGEWERCGKPQTGQKMAVVLQRRDSDDSSKPSKIQSCHLV